MLKNKKRWFQNLFRQCILSRENYLAPQELRKQCTDLRHAIDAVQLRKKIDQDETTVRSISCQLTSSPTHTNHRYTTDDQSTWLHQELMIIEEGDQKTRNQPSELHITESQSSVYSSSIAAMKSKSRLPPTGLTNELYFASHKADGDNEKTPPVLMRNKGRSPYLNIVPIDGTPSMSNNRRPIPSPVRSTTYVLQQHNRIANNQNHTLNRKRSSPVHQSPSRTPMTLNQSRQTQQQRNFSNHERLPATVDSPPTPHQHLSSRTHIALTPRRTSPIVRSTPTKTTTTYVSRSPRIPSTPPIRPSRPTATIQARSPRVPLRSPHLTSTTQGTISSSPTTNKTIRPQNPPSKSPEQLRSVTGIVNRPRFAHSMVNRTNNSATINTKPRKPIVVQTSPSTARASDLDALMAEKHLTETPSPVPSKPAIIPPSPLVKNIRRSLFSTASVKVVRPVRSQELKIFSCHLTPNTSTPPEAAKVSDEISSPTTIDETFSILTLQSSDPPTNNKSFDKQMIEQNEDDASNTSAVLRDLSDDSLNSLDEHYHIRQLLKSNPSITATNNDSIPNASSNEDIPDSSAVTSWSRIRSSCDSNISHIAPLKSDTSTSPACYNGPIRQEDIQMASDGRYFFLIDDNLSSEENEPSETTSPSLSPSLLSLIKPSILPSERKSFVHRLVFPSRLGRIIFSRRILSDSDIYQKLCSKDHEIKHNVYHLDTIRDYAMEFYMLTTYGSDSQLRAWFTSSNSEEFGHNTCYFDDNRFQSFDDDDEEEEEGNRLKRTSSSDSIIPEEDLKRLQVGEELDWYSELESFNFSSSNQQWRNENVSSCSSEDHVGDLLCAEQFSVSSLTTTTSADSSSSAGLISASWPLANGIQYQVHSNRSSQSLGSPLLSNLDDQSNTILKEILTYPWTNDISHSNPSETDLDPSENGPTSSALPDQFQPDFYYLSPLKNTTSSLKTDEKTNGIPPQLSPDA